MHAAFRHVRIDSDSYVWHSVYQMHCTFFLYEERLKGRGRTINKPLVTTMAVNHKPVVLVNTFIWKDWLYLWRGEPNRSNVQIPNNSVSKYLKQDLFDYKKAVHTLRFMAFCPFISGSIVGEQKNDRKWEKKGERDTQSVRLQLSAITRLTGSDKWALIPALLFALFSCCHAHAPLCTHTLTF